MTRAEPSKTAGNVEEVSAVPEEKDGLIVLEAIAGATVWDAPEPLDEAAAVLGDGDSGLFVFAEPFSDGALEVLEGPTSGNFELEAALSWSDNG